MALESPPLPPPPLMDWTFSPCAPWPWVVTVLPLVNATEAGPPPPPEPPLPPTDVVTLMLYWLPVSGLGIARVRALAAADPPTPPPPPMLWTTTPKASTSRVLDGAVTWEIAAPVLTVTPDSVAVAAPPLPPPPPLPPTPTAAPKPALTE